MAYHARQQDEGKGLPAALRWYKDLQQKFSEAEVLLPLGAPSHVRNPGSRTLFPLGCRLP